MLESDLSALLLHARFSDAESEAANARCGVRQYSRMRLNVIAKLDVEEAIGHLEDPDLTVGDRIKLRDLILVKNRRDKGGLCRISQAHCKKYGLDAMDAISLFVIGIAVFFFTIIVLNIFEAAFLSQ